MIPLGIFKGQWDSFQLWEWWLFGTSCALFVATNSVIFSQNMIFFTWAKLPLWNWRLHIVGCCWKAQHLPKYWRHDARVLTSYPREGKHVRNELIFSLLFIPFHPIFIHCFGFRYIATGIRDTAWSLYISPGKDKQDRLSVWLADSLADWQK